MFLGDSKVFTSVTAKCTLDVISRGEKIAGEVKGWRIMCRHSIIIYTWAVEVMTPLTVHAAMSCVHDVSDSQLPQAVAVVGHWPADRRHGNRLGWVWLYNRQRGTSKDSHVANEEVWPYFVHVISKPFTAVQNLHQVFHRRCGSRNYKTVLFVCIWHLKMRTKQDAMFKLATCRICFSLLLFSNCVEASLQSCWYRRGYVILDPELNGDLHFKS